MDKVFCPRCGYENETGNRYCRRCGLGIGRLSLMVDDDAGPRAVAASGDSEMVRERRRAVIWRLVTGVVTLLLAVPSSILFVVASFTTQSLLVGLAALVAICFVGVGIRDIASVYRRLQRPLADGEDAAEAPRLEPDSATEATTWRLDTDAVDGEPTRRME